MGGLKKMGSDQPEIFMKYLYSLDEVVGPVTPYGPLRLFLTYDLMDVDDDEWNARQDWYHSRGEISIPMRTIQYMLARIKQPGEAPHPHSNLHPRRFWHAVLSSTLFRLVITKLEEAYSKGKERN